MAIIPRDRVRDIAKEIGLSVANKPDSQEICFVEDDDYGRFIEDRVGERISRELYRYKGKYIG